jgi:hypothetical protein
MTTSGYILPHQPGTTATATATVSGIDQLKLLSKLPKTEKPPKVGDTRIFYDVPEGNLTALVSLGDKFASKKPNEQRELVRRAVGSAVREVRNLEAVNRVEIDASADPHAAGNGFLVSPSNHPVLIIPRTQPSVHTLRDISSPSRLRPRPSSIRISSNRSQNLWR